MAEPSGLALLALMQKSQRAGEDIMTRLTELVEGSLTHDTLEQISLSNAIMQPLIVAGLKVGRTLPATAPPLLDLCSSWAAHHRHAESGVCHFCSLSLSTAAAMGRAHDDFQPRMTVSA